MSGYNVFAPSSSTSGYTIAGAHFVWHVDVGRIAWKVFLDGNNLASQNARVHISFLKDSVMLPGRNLSLGPRAFFWTGGKAENRLGFDCTRPAVDVGKNHGNGRFSGSMTA
jgi:hypothetical protein